MVGLLLNGDVDWIQKEKKIQIYFSDTAVASAWLNWRVSASDGCNKEVQSAVHLQTQDVPGMWQ